MVYTAVDLLLPTMYLHYADLVEQSPEELTRLEREHRGDPVADRIKMLRLLKTGAYRSRRALADVLGYSERQLQRWFDLYRTSGLEALLDRGSPGGSTERITPEAWRTLEAEMKAGRVARLRDAQRFLRERFSISYTIGGLSDLFQRRKTKLKTGRRRNRKASSKEQAAFKKPI
jgi:transposase